jgi:endonuclease-3
MNVVNKVNDLLIKKYGIPERSKINPLPIDMLIATILSQNTNDSNSYKAYQNLKNTYSSWKDAAKADLPVIEELIKTAGLKRQKAKAINAILSNLENDYEYLSFEKLQKMDNDEIFEMLNEIKGIGIKTISCLLLFSLGRNVCPVDTHVHRTLNRIGIVETSAPDETFKLINKKLPEGIAHSIHTNLIRLGREICKASMPLCAECPVKKICKFENKNPEKNVNIKSRNFMLLDNVG